MFAGTDDNSQMNATVCKKVETDKIENGKF